MGQYEFPNPEWAEVSQEGEGKRFKRTPGKLDEICSNFNQQRNLKPPVQTRLVSTESESLH